MSTNRAPTSDMSFRIPDWLFNGLAGVTFALMVPTAIWTVNLEYRLRDSIRLDEQHGADIAHLEANAVAISDIRRDLAVIQTELVYIKTSVAEVKQLVKESTSNR